ncbi:MAG: hypothetical protein SH857_17825 [Chitinophagales bacterium]|nr:hypothetical protein [Chitinophagales bacterium]
MKNKKRFILIVLVCITVTTTTLIALLSFKSPAKPVIIKGSAEQPEEGCVFKTIFEAEKIDSQFIYKTPAKVEQSIEQALEWIMKAQLNSGGWGAGSHDSQNVKNPHEVPADPATTALVAMALLRTDNTPASGKYSTQLNKAMNYLIVAVENSPENDLNITSEVSTQPQIKLGNNIDVILTSQFLTNVLSYLAENPQQQKRVKKCLDKCVAKIQRGQDSNGRMQNGGWAGVLQSSLANNALETASFNGAAVDTVALNKSREYQKSNYDTKSGSIATEDAAGIMLYSISGTSRATANESRIAKDNIEKAKQEGKLNKDEKVTTDNLIKAGMSKTEAYKYAAAYEINEAANAMAQEETVMSGFGNNGGEEYLSYLQTGEGMIMGKNTGWKKWYDNMGGRLLKIQNNDGSWHGHHCITSPVFCTATCLLILSVNNDVQELLSQGAKNVGQH